MPSTRPLPPKRMDGVDQAAFADGPDGLTDPLGSADTVGSADPTGSPDLSSGFSSGFTSGGTEALTAGDDAVATGRAGAATPSVGSWGVPLTGATEVLPPTDAGRPYTGSGDETAVLPPGGPGGPTSPGTAAAHSHDPHEVTVQLDAVQLGAGGVVRAAPGDGHDGGDGPVFVDESGRRSRRFRRIGIAVAMACAVYAVVIVATLVSGNSDAPWLPVPGQQDEQPAGQVDTTPAPVRSAESADPGVSAPEDSPSASEDTLPSPDTGPTASDEATASADPDTSVTPEPPPRTGGETTPGTGPTDPDPEPSLPASSPPEPGGSESPPSSPTGPTTSASPDAGEAGGGDGGAGGAAAQGGVAEEVSADGISAGGVSGDGVSADALSADGISAQRASYAGLPVDLGPSPGLPHDLPLGLSAGSTPPGGSLTAVRLSAPSPLSPSPEYVL
ncbi:hypothetical protein ACFRI7_08140 [Streptomyces sp. NPDC056716]|uniref:hypothetical protein n=1 Tax=unclassified Streptomyces TaxID=2593676 RepID=UPI0036BA8059